MYFIKHVDKDHWDVNEYTIFREHPTSYMIISPYSYTYEVSFTTFEACLSALLQFIEHGQCVILEEKEDYSLG